MISRKHSITGGFLTALAVGVVLSATCAATADAYVYWSNLGGGSGTTIGRANNDGSGVNNAFINGAAGPCGVAVDGSYVYWNNANNSDIGRANLDGTAANPAFVPISGSGGCGVAANASNIFWASGGSGTTLGSAGLDGGSPNTSFIAGTNGPCGVAVNSTHVYWARTSPSGISRANLNGTSVQEGLIPIPLGNPCMVTLNDTHVFWGGGNNAVGRADLNGGNINTTFISGLPSYACGVAVDDKYVYWANTTADTIGRANLDGSGAIANFISGASRPCGLAVNQLSASPVGPSVPVVTVKKRKSRKDGAVNLTVEVSGAGRVAAAQAKNTKQSKTTKITNQSQGARKKTARPLVKKTAKNVIAAGLVKLVIKPSKTAKVKLRRGKRVRVKLLVTYTDTAGATATAKTTVTFKPKRKR